MLVRDSTLNGLRASAVAGLVLLSACHSSSPHQSHSPIEGQGPSRCGDITTRPWCDPSLSATERAQLLLEAMTLAQKLSIMAGDDIIAAASGDPYVGISEGVPELGIPDLRMSDGPVGVRGSPATAFPIPLSLASSFDLTLARRTGKAVANEVRHKGNDLLHAPVVDVMRNPLAGRTFETFGEDPYLVARLGVEWIHGAQSEGIMANVKHYILNTQEGQIGIPPITSLIGARQLVNHIVDDRTLREMHLLPFEAAVKEADVSTVMCSYNFVNFSPTCSSRALLQDILRNEWGFDGFVISDYVLSVKDTVLSVNNGTEIEMPLGMFYTPILLQTAVVAGLIPLEVVDIRIGNILRTLFRFGFFDRPDYVRNDDLINKIAHATVARETAEQGMVLLRNNGILPLAAPGSIAVIGVTAVERPSGGGSSAVIPFAFTSPLQAITDRANGATIEYVDGEDSAAAAALASTSDVAVVFASDKASEGVDKTCLSLDCPPVPLSALGVNLPDPFPKPQDDLIAAVTAANPNTIVVLQTAGPVLTPWRDQVAALLEAWYPGQEGGFAIARVLFGDTDPGGRLPVTFPIQEADTPTAGNPLQYPGVADQVIYTEGVFTGYRWYDENEVAPAYPFGFGLSYTTFSYSGIDVRKVGEKFVASATVHNTGSRPGWATPQLYLSLPSPSESILQPPKALKGFSKMWLAAGTSAPVEFELQPKAFTYWSTQTAGWAIADGCYVVEIGSDSRTLPLQKTINWTNGAGQVSHCAQN